MADGKNKQGTLKAFLTTTKENPAKSATTGATASTSMASTSAMVPITNAAAPGTSTPTTASPAAGGAQSQPVVVSTASVPTTAPSVAVPNKSASVIASGVKPPVVQATSMKDTGAETTLPVQSQGQVSDGGQQRVQPASAITTTGGPTPPAASMSVPAPSTTGTSAPKSSTVLTNVVAGTSASIAPGAAVKTASLGGTAPPQSTANATMPLTSGPPATTVGVSAPVQGAVNTSGTTAGVPSLVRGNLPASTAVVTASVAVPRTLSSPASTLPSATVPATTSAARTSSSSTTIPATAALASSGTVNLSVAPSVTSMAMSSIPPLPLSFTKAPPKPTVPAKPPGLVLTKTTTAPGPVPPSTMSLAMMRKASGSIPPGRSSSGKSAVTLPPPVLTVGGVPLAKATAHAKPVSSLMAAEGKGKTPTTTVASKYSAGMPNLASASAIAATAMAAGTKARGTAKGAAKGGTKGGAKVAYAYQLPGLVKQPTDGATPTGVSVPSGLPYSTHLPGSFSLASSTSMASTLAATMATTSTLSASAAAAAMNARASAAMNASTVSSATPMFRGGMDQPTGTAPAVPAAPVITPLKDNATTQEAQQALDAICARMQSNPQHLDNRVLLSCMDELRKIELYQNEIGFSHYVPTVVPALLYVLRLVPVAFVKDSDGQSVRNSVLSFIHRLPPSEFVRKFLPDILSLAIDLLEKENEDNCLLCLQILLEKFRSFRPQLPDHVKKFMDFVRKMYSDFRSLVQTMTLTAAQSKAQLTSQLSKHHSELAVKVKEYRNSITTLEKEYTARHDEYKKLQMTATLLNQEQQALRKQMQTRYPASGRGSKSGAPGADALSAKFNSTSMALSQNMAKQKVSHGQLSTLKQKFLERQDIVHRYELMSRECQLDLTRLMDPSVVPASTASPSTPRSAAATAVPRSTATSVVPATIATSVVPASIATSVVPGSTAASVVPRSTPISAVPGSTATSVVSVTTAVSVVPGNTAVSVVPGNTATSVVPRSTPTSVGPGSTTTSVVPGSTAASVVPTTIATSVVSGTTAASVVPGNTATSVVPGNTATSVVSGSTPTSVVPRSTPVSVASGTTGASVASGTTAASVSGAALSMPQPTVGGSVVSTASVGAAPAVPRTSVASGSIPASVAPASTAPSQASATPGSAGAPGTKLAPAAVSLAGTTTATPTVPGVSAAALAKSTTTSVAAATSTPSMVPSSTGKAQGTGVPSSGTPNAPGSTTNPGSAATPTPATPAAAVVSEKRNVPSSATSATSASAVLLRGARSFKVLADCRNIIILLLQLYKDGLRAEIEALVPLMVNALCMTAPPLDLRDPDLRDRHLDFMSSQVKTLWFLPFCFSRNLSELIMPHAKHLSSRVMELLMQIPPHAVTIRKQLLHATKQLLTLTFFRSGFISELDRLMTEDVLLGSGWTAQESLKPLAYSTLADLLHHVRDELTLEQLACAIHTFLKNVLDNSLAMQIQTMSCRLLLNLVPILVPKATADGKVRNLLIQILDTFVTKLGSLRTVQYTQVLHSVRAAQRAKTVRDAPAPPLVGAALPTLTKAKATPKGSALAAKLPPATTATGVKGQGTFVLPVALGGPKRMGGPTAMAADADANSDAGVVWDAERFELPLPVHNIGASFSDGIKDCRALCKTLIAGLKTIVWGIQTVNGQRANINMSLSAAAAAGRVLRLLDGEEVELFHRLLRNGLACFDIYAITNSDQVRDLQNLDTKPTKDEKETIDVFANIFASVNPALFRETFQSSMDVVVDAIVHNNLLLVFPQLILSNKVVSTCFAHYLLQHLLSKLEELGEGDSNACQVLLRLFKLVFGSVNLFAEDNEKILQPYLGTIIHRSLALAATANEPTHYFLLLRALFRSIGGGKFEELYKEFKPLLPTLLNGLNRLQECEHKSSVRDLFVELCLTVPVRLSALLPFLPYLMRPLVLALQSGDELVSQGLRTLELCIDNLSPDFLAPIIEPVKVELMNALWKHMQPVTSNTSGGAVRRASLHGAITFRLLGKLGGRCRDMFQHPPILTPHSSKGAALRVVLSYDKTQLVYLALDEAVKVAVDTLRSGTTDVDHARASFDFLKGALAGLMNLEQIPSGMHKTLFPLHLFPKLHTTTYYVPDSREGDGRCVLNSVMEGLFYAAGNAFLEREAVAFMKSTVTHCVMLSALHALLSDSSKDAQTQRQIDPEVLVEALMLCIASENRTVADCATPMLALSLEVAVKIFGSKDTACKIPFFSALAHHACASCYKREWYYKKAGCIGIRFLMHNMPMEWLMAQQLKFNTALLFTCMDLTDQIGMGVVEESQALMVELISKCFTTGPYDLVHTVTAPPPARAAPPPTTPGTTVAGASLAGGVAQRGVTTTPGGVTATPGGVTGTPSGVTGTPGGATSGTTASGAKSGGTPTSSVGEAAGVTATSDAMDVDDPTSSPPKTLTDIPNTTGAPPSGAAAPAATAVPTTAAAPTPTGTTQSAPGTTPGTAGAATVSAPPSAPPMTSSKGGTSTPSAAPRGVGPSAPTPLSIPAGAAPQTAAPTPAATTAPPLAPTAVPGSMAASVGTTEATEEHRAKKPRIDVSSGDAGSTPPTATTTPSAAAPPLSVTGVVGTTVPVSAGTSTLGVPVAPTSATAVPPSSSGTAGATPSSSGGGGGVTGAGAESNTKRTSTDTEFGKLVKVLAAELLSPDNIVRKQVKETLALLSKFSGIALTNLLLSTSMKHIALPKTTRNCSINVQIGRMDAMTYCLSLQPPLTRLPYSAATGDESQQRGNNNRNYIREVLEICKLNDERARSAMRPGYPVNPTVLMMLRQKAIELVSVVLLDDHWHEFRQVGVEYFVRALLSEHDEIASAATRGLSELQRRVVLPKEVMQGAIRPLLSELSEFTKLTLPMVQAIARLLELLPTSAFNQKFVDRMYEYWEKWYHVARDEATKMCENHSYWRDSDAVNICAAILGLFVKLDGSVRFLIPVAESIMTIEGIMGRFKSSPFRQKVVLFLDKYAAETVEYFMTNIFFPQKSSFFRGVLGLEGAEKLRERMLQNIPTITKQTFQASKDKHKMPSLIRDGDRLFFEGVCLCQILLDADPATNKPLLQPLLAHVQAMWDVPEFINRIAQKNSATYKGIVDPRTFIELQLSFATAGNPEHIEMLLRMLLLFPMKTLVDTSVLTRFYNVEVAQGYHADTKRQILQRCLKLLQERKVPQSMIKDAIHRLCIPLVVEAMAAGTVLEVCGTGADGIVNQWVTILSKPTLYIDDLKITIMQFTIVLIRCAVENVHFMQLFTNDLKHKLLGFAWTCTFQGLNGWDVSDPTVKYSGYVLVCEIMSGFKYCPRELLLELYETLVNAHSSEQGKLLRHGIDIVQELLSKYAAPQPGAVPEWITIVRKVLANDNLSQSRVQHLWSIVLRHPNHFYPHRHLFVPWIVQSLGRVLSSGGAQPDTRKLPIEIAGLLIAWDEQALQADAEHKARLTAGGSSKAAKQRRVLAASEPRAFIMTERMQDAVVNFLTLSACSTSDAQGSTLTAAQIANHCIKLLSKVLVPNFWLPSTVSVARCDKVLAQCPQEIPDNQPYQNYINILEILKLLLVRLPPSSAITQVGLLHNGLIRVSMCRHPEVSEVFRTVLNELLHIFPMKGPASKLTTELVRIYKFCTQFIEKWLTEFEKAGHAQVYHVLQMFIVFQKQNPLMIEQHIGQIVKVLHSACKDHLTPAGGVAPTAVGAGDVVAGAAGGPAHPLSAADVANVERTLVLCFVLVLPHIFAKDVPFRKPVIALTVQAAEKATAVVVECIVSLCGKAVLDYKNQSVPTREKVSLFAKVTTSFIKRFPTHDKINSVYSTVLTIFQCKELKNTEVTSRLEAVFMLGMAAPTLGIRESFFELYNAPNKDASLHGYLDYCFSDKFQRWENSKGVFWVKYCLDVVLMGTAGTLQVSAGPGVARLPPLVPTGPPHTQPKADAAHYRGVGKTIYELATQHDVWLAAQRRLTVSTLVKSLRTLCHIAPPLAYDMWVHLFPLLWHVLPDTARDSVGVTMQNLLTHEYHTDQASVRPNNVRALVTGISKCVPWTAGPQPTLLYHLAKTHNLWHAAIAMLKTQAVRADQTRAENKQDAAAAVAASASSKRGGANLAADKYLDGRIDPIQDAMADLYTRLGEMDTWFGHWRLRSKLQLSATALAYEQHGLWDKAQTQYENVMQTSIPPPPHGIRDAEFQLWETHWITCSEKLGNHELLLKYGEETKNLDLMLKSAWKLKSWKKLKDTLRRAQAQREPSFDLYLAKAYMSIATADEVDIKNIEKVCMEGTQLALKTWAELPTAVSQSHIPILEAAQRFVELQESADLYMSLHPNSALPQPTQESSNLVEMWRKRLPNEWEDINVWQNILSWRHFVFEKIGVVNTKAEIPRADGRIQFAQNEITWTINTLSSVARGHNLKALCERNLNMMYKLQNVDVGHLFAKAREQVLCFMELNKEDYKLQLDAIENVNLKYFDKCQSAELYAYKGKVLHQKGDWQEANKVFSMALTLCEDLGVGWESWAIYCDDMFRRVVESIRQLRADSNGNKRAKTDAKGSATESNAREWAKSAITCYLHACRSFGDDEKIKRMTARVLLLLTNDDATGEVSQTFNRLSDSIETALWKLWIPQLLTSLSRPEAESVHNVLVRLAKYHPQALYYALRTTFLEIRSADSHKQSQQRKPDGTDGNTPDAARKRKSTAPDAGPSPAGGIPTATGATVGAAVDEAEAKRRKGDSGTPVSGTSTAAGSSANSAPATTASSAATAMTAGDTTGTPALMTAGAGPSVATPTPTASSATATPSVTAAAATPVAGTSAAAAASAAPASTVSASGTPAAAANATPATGAVTTPAPSTSTTTTTTTTTPSELAHVSSVMQNLRLKHSMLAGALENMIEDLVARFKPTPEEELLRTIHVLLTECLKHALGHLDRAVVGDGAAGSGAPEDVAVPPHLVLHIRRLSQTFFGPRIVAMNKYRTRFHTDFGALETTTLDQCLRRLHDWHRHLTGAIARMPTNHRLEDFSHFLVNFSGGHTEIDLPGEHLVRTAAQQQAHTIVRVERFMPVVKVIHKHSAAYRQITIRGRDGRRYPYLIHLASTHPARTEERFMHFLRILNVFLERGREARKRSLRFHVPRVVPLNTHVRLVQHDDTVLSLEDVFHEFCTTSNTTMEQPTMETYHLRRQELINSRKEARPPRDIRKEIFEKIRHQNVPSDIFVRFVRGSFPDHTDLWMFQKQFTSQLALSAFANYVLMLSSGAPHTLLFALNSGNVIPWDMRVSCNASGHLVTPDPVPFRLTPNLVNVVSPVGITGLFCATMVASAQAITEPDYRIQDYLGTLLRDEMISWHANNKEPYKKAAIANDALVALVDHNTASIKTRLDALATCDGTNENVDTLIKQATASRNLSNMPPMWQPWL